LVRKFLGELFQGFIPWVNPVQPANFQFPGNFFTRLPGIWEILPFLLIYRDFYSKKTGLKWKFKNPRKKVKEIGQNQKKLKKTTPRKPSKRKGLLNFRDFFLQL